MNERPSFRPTHFLAALAILLLGCVAGSAYEKSQIRAEAGMKEWKP